MKLKMMFSSLLAVAFMAGGVVTAFAAEPEETAVSYGYLAGQQQNRNRQAQFESIRNFDSDAEREAFFEAQGIGGRQYSNWKRLDVEALVKESIIDQATADSIKAYGSNKHDLLHNRYGSDMSTMTPDERHAHYASYEKDSFSGDSVEELLSEGVITQEQADAINAYIE